MTRAVLLAINLFSCVDHPFTGKAVFDWELFREHVAARRLMDDIIDLELEKIDAILDKIAADRRTTEIKRTERNLWLRIQDKNPGRRRTGIEYYCGRRLCWLRLGFVAAVTEGSAFR